MAKSLQSMLDEFWAENELPGNPEIETDNNGQLVIFTGMVSDGGELRELTETDLEN